MAWRLAKSLQQLINQYNQAYPNRNRASDGTIGDAAHAAVKSEHNPNSAGVVTAMDITHDPANGADMNLLKEELIKDARTWYVIFNSRIWETGVGWKPYRGSNPHDKHLHISTKQDAPTYDNTNQWNIGEDMAQPADYPTANIYAQTLLFRDMGEEEFNKFHRGKTREQLFDSFRNAPERYQNIKKMIESDNRDLDENSKKLKEALQEFLN